MFYLKNRGRSKYGNKKIQMDGYQFASLKESRRYTQLTLMQKSGQIKNLVVHPVFEISVNGKKICNYCADFSYLVEARKVIPEGEVVSFVREKDMLFERVVEDVKSEPTKTATYRLKKKLMKACHGIAVREI